MNYQESTEKIRMIEELSKIIRDEFQARFAFTTKQVSMDDATIQNLKKQIKLLSKNIFSE